MTQLFLLTPWAFKPHGLPLDSSKARGKPNTYQWWEGAIYSILAVSVYPFAWSWLQWRQRLKLQLLREFVRSEYDHACLRSCHSRALYEGIKIAATSDLMLAYIDFFLGGDEKRSDLPPPLCRRFPMSLLFGGDGSYMAPFSLQSDNIITSLMSQMVAFICGYVHYKTQSPSKKPPNFQPWSISIDESEWWIFPAGYT